MRARHLRRLARSAAARRDHGVFIVEGATLVAEAHAAGMAVQSVYLEDCRADDEERDLAGRLAADGAEFVAVDPGALEDVGASVTPPPLMALVERPADVTGRDVPMAPGDLRFVLVAVSVADPGNAGALVRCAEAAGADGAIFAGGGVDPYGPKAVRASAGSVFRLPTVCSDDPAGALEGLGGRGLRRVGAAAHRGEPYDRADLLEPLALVVGNESHGLSAALGACIDGWTHVPLTGLAESLNVGAAAAILCFEVQRRRRGDLAEPVLEPQMRQSERS